MSKKILVLTGSARKGGNSNRMAQAFADAAAAKGNEVKVIDTTKLKLNFCHACQTCYKSGKPCSRCGASGIGCVFPSRRLSSAHPWGDW